MGAILTPQGTSYLYQPSPVVAVEVGDTKQPDLFYPQFKLLRWENEANFSARVQVPGTNAQDVSVDGEGRITWTKGNYQARFYDKPDASDAGGFEFEVILWKKPPANAITFTLQTKGLDFFYQPALTQKEIDEGHERPQNVVGSYAVYHSSKTGNAYRTGKAFHLYRPHVVDAKGNETWGTISIDRVAGTMTVTVPQEFLDGAAYPVIVDPTFGYTTAGSSNTSISSNVWYGISASAGANGSVDSISAYVRSQFGSTGNCKAVITDSSKNILTNGTGGTDGTNSLSQVLITMPYTSKPSVTNGTSYWLGFVVDSGNLSVYYDIGSTGDGASDFSNSYSSPSSPTDASNNTNRYSIYATTSNAALAQSVSESISVAENRRIGMPIIVSKSDAVSVAENTRVNIPRIASKFETISATEMAKGAVSLAARLSEVISVLENAKAAVSPIRASKFEAITAAESVVAQLTLFGTAIQVFDSITAGESVTATLRVARIKPSVSDSITAAESVALRLNPLVRSIADAITAVESAVATLNTARLKPSVSDSITAAESAAATLNLARLKRSISDAVTVAEQAKAVISPLIVKSVGDTATALEFVKAVLAPLKRSLADTITVLELTKAVLNKVAIHKQENITVLETVTALIRKGLDVNKFETITTNELAKAAIRPLLRKVSEAISVAESTAQNLLAHVYRTSQMQNVTVAETAQASTYALRLKLNIAEAISVTEYAKDAIGPLLVSKAETVSVGDFGRAIVNPLRRSVTDAITALESVKAMMPLSRLRSDSITATESASATLRTARLKVSAMESILTGEFAKAVVPLLQAVGDSVTAAESATALAKSLRLKVSAMDAVSIAEAASAAERLIQLWRTGADPVAIGEAANAFLMWVRIKGFASDSPVLYEFARAAAGKYVARPSDAITTVDSATVQASPGRLKATGSDAVTVAETAKASPTLGAHPADSVTVSESRTAAAAAARLKPTPAETITTGELGKAAVSLAPKPADAATVVESAIAAFLTARIKVAVNEAITITENVRLKLQPLAARTWEVSTVAENAAAALKLIQLWRAVSDAATVGETASGFPRIARIKGSAFDAPVLYEFAKAAMGTFARLVSDAITTADSPAARLQLGTRRSEAIQTLENAVSSLATVRLKTLQQEIVSVSDFAKTAMSPLLRLSDAVAVAETAKVRRDGAKSVADIATIAEFLTAVFSVIRAARLSAKVAMLAVPVAPVLTLQYPAAVATVTGVPSTTVRSIQ